MLKDEISPYLIAHASNPVDWYPWGERAISRAKTENMPIFLSIGYSACHWCHVMENESFTNLEVANFLNENFVSIKVDREEHPDIDKIYMDALIAMTGSGGWPMSMFLDPDLNPFYGGSYFPPQARFGLPGFLDLLIKISSMWKTNSLHLRSNGVKIREYLARPTLMSNDPNIENSLLIQQSIQMIYQQMDKINGGWGSRPKFPHALAIQFLLDRNLNLSQEIIPQLEKTLDEMALGGFHDLVRGGFHRYSTDEIWLVPHFEKMLYDNALLAPTFLNAGKILKNDVFIKIALKTLDFMKNELISPFGGFWSSLDADSDGEEGKFYTWTYEELKELIPQKDWNSFCDMFQIENNGNFDGKILLRLKNLLFPLKWTNPLIKAQNERLRPNTDDKILLDWNSLAISAFASCGYILQNNEFVKIAENAANFILDQMAIEDQLFHAFRNGNKKESVFLSDYSFIINALVDLFLATLDYKWMSQALLLCDKMVKIFWDGRQFFDTPANENFLFIRPQTVDDSVTPSGWSMAVYVLYRLNLFRDQTKFEEVIEISTRAMVEQVKSSPLSMALWLKIFNQITHPQNYIILIKTPEDETNADEYEKYIRSKIYPQLIFMSIHEEDPLLTKLAILKDKKCYSHKSTVYICFNNACSAPIIDFETLQNTIIQV